MTQHLCDSEFPWCTPDAKAGDFYKLRVKDLSPTQFAVGKAEVDVRAGRMRKKFKKDPGKLHDHHHMVRALYDALHKTRGKDICVYVTVMGNAGTLERVMTLISHEGNHP